MNSVSVGNSKYEKLSSEFPLNQPRGVKLHIKHMMLLCELIQNESSTTVLI
jgi:hypothetical protein